MTYILKCVSNFCLCDGKQNVGSHIQNSGKKKIKFEFKKTFTAKHVFFQNLVSLSPENWNPCKTRGGQGAEKAFTDINQKKQRREATSTEYFFCVSVGKCPYVCKYVCIHVSPIILYDSSTLSAYRSSDHLFSYTTNKHYLSSPESKFLESMQEKKKIKGHEPKHNFVTIWIW